MAKEVTIERDLSQPFSIIWKFRVNQNYVDKLKSAGLDTTLRTRSFELGKLGENMDEAKAIGINPFAHRRIDAANNAKADSGIKPFGDGKEGLRVNLKHFWKNLFDMSFQLQKHAIFKKQNDNMYFIEFVFVKTKFEGEVEDSAADFLEMISDNTFEHVHIWSNPNQTITVNCAHLLGKTNSDNFLTIKSNPSGLVMSVGK